MIKGFLMNQLLNYIGSRRFAVILLTVATTVILAANLLPNLAVMERSEVDRIRKERPLIYGLSAKFGVRRIANSTYFKAVPVFLFLSITVCTLRRLRSELERLEREEEVPSDLPVKYSVDIREGMGRDEMILMLRRGRWKVLEDSGVIYAKKGEKGIWGSFAFHGGMNIALIGILVSIVAGVDGMLQLTEGFPITAPEASKALRSVDVVDFPFNEVMLESFEPVYQDRSPVEYNVKLVGGGRDGRLREYKLGVNDPLVHGGYKFIFNRAGFAPRFVLEKEGKALADVVAVLYITMPGKTDYFDIPEEGIRIKAEMFPDFYMEGGQPKTKGWYPFNPVLFVEIEKEGKMIGRGFLPTNKKVNFDKYSLELTELRHWVDLVVTKDPGVPIMTLGFALISLGLLTRFILNERHLWIIMNEMGCPTGVGGRARYFPAIFEEELKRISERIGGRGV